MTTTPEIAWNILAVYGMISGISILVSDHKGVLLGYILGFGMVVSSFLVLLGY